MFFLSPALDVQLGVLIFCDDPSVQQAVSSAVSKFNERLSTGHKLALFQTLSASKVRALLKGWSSQRVSGFILGLSKCILILVVLECKKNERTP